MFIYNFAEQIFILEALYYVYSIWEILKNVFSSRSRTYVSL